MGSEVSVWLAPTQRSLKMPYHLVVAIPIDILSYNRRFIHQEKHGCLAQKGGCQVCQDQYKGSLTKSVWVIANRKVKSLFDCADVTLDKPKNGGDKLLPHDISKKACVTPSSPRHVPMVHLSRMFH